MAVMSACVCFVKAMPWGESTKAGKTRVSSRNRASSSTWFPTKNQIVRFKATRAVRIPFRQLDDFPGEDYVKEVDRIVSVTFPDSARIDKLSSDSWRSRLKPITFFSVSATPICYLRVYYDKKRSVLKLESDKLVLEFISFPFGLDDLNLKFSVAGDLAAAINSAHDHLHRFQGSVCLELECDLPLPFSLMPEAAVLPVGNTILDRILGAMESALTTGLARDYQLWCKLGKQQSSPAPAGAGAGAGAGAP